MTSCDAMLWHTRDATYDEGDLVAGQKVSKRPQFRKDTIDRNMGLSRPIVAKVIKQHGATA